jgi:DNA-binding SARP family transcriptional activator
MLLPALDEKSANRDFKVALNALQTALEPHRRARSNPYFIIRIGTAYQLNPNAGWILDTVEFEERVKEGLESDRAEEAIHALEQGLQLYKGDYMPERRYDDWCIEERERLQVQYLRGAERLAQLYEESGQYNKSIRWCEAMLQKDVCWEEAYRLLIRCHVQLNNRNQAMKWYNKCLSALEQELGIEPMPQTKELYLKLTDTEGNVTHL